MPFHVPKQYRIHTPLIPVSATSGAFRIPLLKRRPDTYFLQVIAGKSDGWEHVSVVHNHGSSIKTPSWDHMCIVKDLFWHEDDTVIQFHPRKSEYVNTHKNCLHLWREIARNNKLPPKFLI